jgi:COP9 signalosome complex subunit 8
MIVAYLLPNISKDSFRFRTFDLLSKAYTSLSLSLASAYLGMPGPQIIAGNLPFFSTSDISQLHLVAEKSAWTYDASTQILSPKMRSNALDQIGPSSSEFGTWYSRS